MTSSSPETPRGADTLAWAVARCAPSFSEALVGGADAALLSAACAELPLDLSTFWGVEAPLGDPRPGVDVLVEIKRGSPGHQVLASEADPLVEARCGRSEAWRALQVFARRWADRDDALHGSVRNIWLEFDLMAASRSGDGLGALDRPCVFWGPAVEAMGPLLDGVAGAFAAFPRDVPAAALDRAARALPDGARIFQVGAMHARGDVVLRVCVNRMAPDAVPAWLSAIDWPGDRAAFARAIDALAPLVRTLAVDVDFTAAGVGAKVGIECYQDWTSLDSAQWTPLLDHADRLGLLDPGKRRAIEAFPARTDFPIAAQLPFKRRGFLFPVLYRNVHHVKLAFRETAFAEAKAYLGVARPGVNVEAFTRTGTADVSAEGWLAP